MRMIKTEQDLQDSIDDDFAWRFWEIISLKSILNENTVERFEASLVRSLVVVAYCHWEGFVKSSVTNFLHYIQFLQLVKSKLSSGFLASCIYYTVQDEGVVNGIAKLQDIIEKKDYTFSYRIEKMASAESNLNSKVLSKIAKGINLDISSFSTRFNELDVKILGRRNHMAHGDREMIDKQYGLEVAEASINLMRLFKTSLQDMITKKEYRV